MAWYKTADYVNLLKETLKKDTRRTLTILDDTLRADSPFRSRIPLIINVYNTNLRNYNLGLTTDTTVPVKVTQLLNELLKRIREESGKYISLRKVAPIDNLLIEYSKSDVDKHRKYKARRSKKKGLSLLKGWQLIAIACMILVVTIWILGYESNDLPTAQSYFGELTDTEETIYGWAIILNEHTQLEPAISEKGNYTKYRDIEIYQNKANAFITLMRFNSKAKAVKKSKSSHVQKAWPDPPIKPITCQLGYFDSDDYLTCR